MLFKFAYAIMRAALFFIYPCKIVGRENIPQGAALVCGNHSDNLDPIMAVFALGISSDPRILAKKELFRGRFLNWFFRGIGAIPVDRKAADVAAVKDCLKALHDGHKLLMFPEGTRGNSEDFSQAKAGAGMFAARTDSNILPVYIQPHKKLFRKNLVIIGKPYKAECSEKSQEVYKAVADGIMDKIRALRDGENL